MALLESTICLFCLNPTGARIGLDKKGRPFMHCIGCGARCFLPNFAPCLNGIAVLTPIAHAILDEIARDKGAWEQFHGQIATLLAQLRAQMNAPVATPNGSSQPANGTTLVAPIVRSA